MFCLPVRSLSAPPSVLVLEIDGFRMITEAFGCGMLGRTCFVSEGDVSLATSVCALVVTGYEFASYALQTTKLSPGVSNALTHLNLLLSGDEFLFDVTGQSSSKIVHHALLEIPS